MYWRLGNDTRSGTYDRAASIWFAALCVIFQSGNNACTIFYSQKPLLRRELSSGLYHYSAFYVAKSLTSLPFQLAYAVIFNATVYFLARPAAGPRPPALRPWSSLAGAVASSPCPRPGTHACWHACSPARMVHHCLVCSTAPTSQSACSLLPPPSAQLLVTRDRARSRHAHAPASCSALGNTEARFLHHIRLG